MQAAHAVLDLTVVAKKKDDSSSFYLFYFFYRCRHQQEVSERERLGSPALSVTELMSPLGVHSVYVGSSRSFCTSDPIAASCF